MGNAILAGLAQRRSRWFWCSAHNAELLAVLALTLLYIALMSAHLQSIDGILMFNQTRAMVFDGSFQFSQPIGGDRLMTSPHPIGLSLLYLPGFVVWSVVQPFVPVDIRYPDDWSSPAGDPLYAIIGAPIHILIAAATAYLVARFGQELGLSRHASLWGVAFYGLGSPAIVYAREDWSQPLTGLCVIAALYAALRFRRTRRLTALATCGGILMFAVLTRPLESVFLALAVTLLVAPHLRPWRWSAAAWRTVGVLVVSVAIGAAITVLVNRARIDSGGSGGIAPGYEGEGWSTPLWVGLPGALISPGRGILWSFPAVLLVPLGFRRLWPTSNRVVGVAFGLVTGLMLLSTATWYAWWGGWSWGLRLFIPALPLLAVLAACGVAALPHAKRRWLPGLLIVGGLVWATPCIVTYIEAGYSAAHSGSTVDQYRWDAYPPIGAWQYLDRWRAETLDDQRSVDIIWWRVAHRSHNLSLALPVLLVLGALLVAGRVRSLLADPPGSAVRVRGPATARRGDAPLSP